MICIILILYFYLGISLGLYFKTELLNTDMVTKKGAFLALPNLVAITVHSMVTPTQESSRTVIKALIKYPYRLLLASWISMSR